MAIRGKVGNRVIIVDDDFPTAHQVNVFIRECRRRLHDEGVHGVFFRDSLLELLRCQNRGILDFLSRVVLVIIVDSDRAGQRQGDNHGQVTQVSFPVLNSGVVCPSRIAVGACGASVVVVVILQTIDFITDRLATANDVSRALGLEIALRRVEPSHIVLDKDALDHLGDYILDVVRVSRHDRCADTVIFKADIAVSVLILLTVHSCVGAGRILDNTFGVLDFLILACTIVIGAKRNIIDDSHLHAATGIADAAYTLMQTLGCYADSGPLDDLTRLDVRNNDRNVVHNFRFCLVDNKVSRC